MTCNLTTLVFKGKIQVLGVRTQLLILKYLHIYFQKTVYKTNKYDMNWIWPMASARNKNSALSMAVEGNTELYGLSDTIGGNK